MSNRPFNVYLESEDPVFLDSMEGVPEIPKRAVLPTEQFLRTGWQKALHRALHALGLHLPGLALAAIVAWSGLLLSNFVGSSLLGFEHSPLSPILCTVLLGLIIRNLAGLPGLYEDGLRFCVKRILRIGVALLGLRLSLAAVGEIGLSALPIVLLCIVSALLFVAWLARAVGISRRLGTLIAVGTSICGVSAIVATGPAIDADEEEVGYSVACITLFGMLALLFYPLLSHFVFSGDETLAGLFLGTAIHDTSQVAGAGLMFEQQYAAPRALHVATTTKLLRNLCMGVVIPLVVVLHHRRYQVRGKATWLKWKQWLPLFVLGFIAMAALRTIGDLGEERAFGILEPHAWKAILDSATSVSVACLALAMAAVGLGTSVAQMKKLGWKPFTVGFAAALVVGVVSGLLVTLLGRVL